MAAGAAAAIAAAARPSIAAPTVSSAALEEFPYDAVELTGGPLKAQYDRVHASYLALSNDRLLKIYRRRAGMPDPGLPMGGWYGHDGFVPGHSLGQYISGLARIGRTTGDAACHAKVAELVEGFAATMGPKDVVFGAPNAEKVWPCYILDKHLIGLIDAYRLSGLAHARELLPRVYRGALPWIPAHGHDRIGRKNPPYDETYVLPENLFSGWEITGDRAFHDRAVTYLLDRDYFDPLARNQDVLPGRQAYSHAIALSSAAKARLVLGEESYLRTMKNAWEFLRNDQQYATGGWGPNELFVEPHQGRLFESLYSTTHHFETPCGSYAATKLARYLLCATGDARYADGLERVVFNALLAVKEPDSDGDYFYYSSYSAGARKGYYPQKWPCCSGTLVQGVADYAKNIYFRAPDGLAVTLYAPSRVRWTEQGLAVSVEQRTNYPLDDRITIRVTCTAPVKFALRMRIPAWLEERPAIQVNGQPSAFQAIRGFAVLRRVWRSGDVVSLDLPQSFRTEAIDDRHPNTVALLRGPLVYVEMNPAPGPAPLISAAKLRAVPDTSGFYCRDAPGQQRVFTPLYKIHTETYTTYFEKA